MTPNFLRNGAYARSDFFALLLCNRNPNEKFIRFTSIGDGVRHNAVRLHRPNYRLMLAPVFNGYNPPVLREFRSTRTGCDSVNGNRENNN